MSKILIKLKFMWRSGIGDGIQAILTKNVTLPRGSKKCSDGGRGNGARNFLL